MIYRVRSSAQYSVGAYVAEQKSVDFNVNLSCDVPKYSVEKSESEKLGCQFSFSVLVP